MGTDTDFDIEVTVVDQDTAEQRVTEPATHDEDLFRKKSEADELP